MRTKYYGIVGEMSKLKEAGINKLIKELGCPVCRTKNALD